MLGTEHVIMNGQTRNFTLLTERCPSSHHMTDTADNGEPRDYPKLTLPFPTPSHYRALSFFIARTEILAAF